MRQIRFRAWNKAIKEMSDWESLRRSVSVICIISGEHPYIVPMQYTGLHDKDGVEIYEGDIINFENKPPFVDLPCEVVFDEDVAAFAVHNYDISRHTMFYELPDVDYEVIGNVHENPELIEKGT